MDENQFELAEELERMAVEIALKKARERLHYSLQPTNICYNCHEPIEWPRLFCDVDYEKDFTLRTKRREQNGQ